MHSFIRLFNHPFIHSSSSSSSLLISLSLSLSLSLSFFVFLAFVQAKPKGQIRLSGYRVEKNPNEFAKQNLQKLFQELKIDEAVPDKNDFKPYTIELYHPSRRCWFVVCENEDEFNSWCETFKTVCWRAPGMSNDDPVAQHAFHHAIRETRWSLGRWGWWGYGGSEEDILSDMVSEHINWLVRRRSGGT